MEVARMLTLAEQCLERAKSFVGKSTEPPDLSASAFSSGSPGLPEPHQTAVAPASHAADTGEYVLQSEASLLQTHWLVTAKLEPRVTGQM